MQHVTNWSTLGWSVKREKWGKTRMKKKWGEKWDAQMDKSYYEWKGHFESGRNLLSVWLTNDQIGWIA